MKVIKCHRRAASRLISRSPCEAKSVTEGRPLGSFPGSHVGPKPTITQSDRTFFSPFFEELNDFFPRIGSRVNTPKTCDARQSKHYVGVAGKIPVI